MTNKGSDLHVVVDATLALDESMWGAGEMILDKMARGDYRHRSELIEAVIGLVREDPIKFLEEANFSVQIGFRDPGAPTELTGDDG